MMSIDLKCEAESTQGLLKDVEYHRSMELSRFYSHGPAVWQFEPLYSTINIQEKGKQKTRRQKKTG